jgi:RHS repeat-associated protein
VILGLESEMLELESDSGGGETDIAEPTCWWVSHQTDRYYVWSGGVVLREYEITDGTATTSGTGDHVYGLGRRLATRRPNAGSDTVNLYVYDYLGNVKSYQTSAGGLYETNLEYYPYGGMYSRNGNGAGRYTFQGKENDHTLQADFGPRYYSPLAGRFLAPDPVRSSYSPYAYTPGNPIMMNDPTGMTAAAATLQWLGMLRKWWTAYTDEDARRTEEWNRQAREAQAEYRAERQAVNEQFMNGGGFTGGNSGTPSGIEDNPKGFPGAGSSLKGLTWTIVGARKVDDPTTYKTIPADPSVPYSQPGYEISGHSHVEAVYGWARTGSSSGGDGDWGKANFSDLSYDYLAWPVPQTAGVGVGGGITSVDSPSGQHAEYIHLGVTFGAQVPWNRFPTFTYGKVAGDFKPDNWGVMVDVTQTAGGGVETYGNFGGGG